MHDTVGSTVPKSEWVSVAGCVLETLPQEDLSVLEDGSAFLLTCWRVRRASNTV